MTATASMTVCQPEPRYGRRRTRLVRCGRPATSTSALLGSSRRTGPIRSPGSRRTNSDHRWCSANAACATPVGLGGRTPADPPGRPREPCGDAPHRRIRTRVVRPGPRSPPAATAATHRHRPHIHLGQPDEQRAHARSNRRRVRDPPRITRSTSPNPQTRSARSPALRQAEVASIGRVRSVPFGSRSVNASPAATDHSRSRLTGGSSHGSAASEVRAPVIANIEFRAVGRR